MTSWAAVVGVQEELEAAIKHRQEVFEAADVDDSGYLEIDEIDSVCRELGKKLSEEKLNSAMDEMDKDQSGEPPRYWSLASGLHSSQYASDRCGQVR